MVDAKNFVEKTLGVSLDKDKEPESKNNIGENSESKESIFTYTPPPAQKQNPIQFQNQNIQQPTIQIVEKIVYKKQRIHGFFRTLTIIALLTIGFLMLGESTGLITLSVNSFKLHQIFPIFIIFSTIIIRSYKWVFGKLFGLILFLTVFGWIFTIGIYTSLNPSSKRKSGSNINYTITETSGDTEKNLYLETLIGNSYIEGDNKSNNIQATRNSDRKLLVSSGNDTKENYLRLYEDRNRNVLQNYISNINLTIPNNSTLDLLYIKNLFWLHTINLNTFKRKMVKIHAGIDDITIKIGNVLSGNKVEIQGTATNIDVEIPKDIGVIMYYKHLVGLLNAPEFDTLSGHYFQSKNISTAKALLNIYVNLWVSNTKIHRVEPK